MSSKDREEIHGLHRLSDEQLKALEDTEAAKEKWERYRSDYQKLRKKLETLPDKLTHDVMVPFGSLAFMPGKLVHSNEIMVLLGDDWFSERSAKQACHIVDRRIKSIDEQTRKLREQWKLLDSRKDFTNEFLEATEAHGDFVEIKEDYDEKQEKEWRESRKRSLVKDRKRKFNEQTTEVDDELMKRLNELELLEEEEDSDENVDHEREEQVVADTDEDSDDDEEDDEDDDDDEDEDVVKDSDNHVIRFTHTTVPDVTSDIDDGMHVGDGDTTKDHTGPGIQSPADIYRLFHSTPPIKSILKHSPSLDLGTERPHVRFLDTEFSDSGKGNNSVSRTVNEPRLESRTSDEPSFEAGLAFTGEVKERSTATSDVTETAHQSTKRVSKFKQQRQQQQKARR